MERKTLLVVLVALLVIAGCDTMGPKAKTGAVAGGLLGATAGGVIGHQMGKHGLGGAAIGAAIGALGGGLIGNEMDKQALAVNPNHLSTMAIAEMAKKGTPDAVIIDEIKRTNSVYELNAELIDYLKKNGVSDKVIDYMLATSRK